jgi:drug/metabolite transporter (DMT)-like permease
MMTQNIPYRGYLSSKWWLMVIATIVTTTIASFYLYFGLHVYLTIVVAAIYNIESTLISFYLGVLIENAY